MRLLAPLRLGRLLSSFHLLGHPWGVSNITTRANNQFPWPDFHRLDKQPYRLQTKDTKNKLKQKFFFPSCSSCPPLKIPPEGLRSVQAEPLDCVIPAWSAGIQVDTDVSGCILAN